MGRVSTGSYRFGDLLALARASWVAQMAAALEERGYPGYRRTDAWIMRRLLAGPLAITHVGPLLNVTRQAGRKFVSGLLDRGYATTEPDPHDGRRVNVILTAVGHAYAAAVAEAMGSLNQALADQVDPGDLAAADRVLRAVLDEGTRRRADQGIAPPPAGPP